MSTELTAPTANTYNTLEEILQRKDELSDAIERDSEQIGTMWNQMFAKSEESTKGEYIASLVTNSITAIDAFIMVRKLMKRYGGLANLFSGSSSKKKKSRRR